MPSAPHGVGEGGMVMECSEDFPVTTLAAEEELGDAGDGRRARAGAIGDFPIREAAGEECRHLQALAQGFDLAQGRDIPEEVCDVLRCPACEESLTELAHCGVSSPSVFEEAALHRAQGR